FSFYCSGPPLLLHSFPTRRSSDLPWIFGAVFLVVLALLLLISRIERSAAVRPFKRKARDLGPVRCKRCGFEGVLKVQVKIQLGRDRKSTRLNSSHLVISYAVFCLK